MGALGFWPDEDIPKARSVYPPGYGIKIRYGYSGNHYPVHITGNLISGIKPRIPQQQRRIPGICFFRKDPYL
jgi:hypothetical protein